MVLSSKPSAQRRSVYNLPRHLSKRKLRGHLSEDLRNQHGRKSVTIRRGDRLVILKGDFKGIEGDVTRVDRKHGKVFVEGASRENVKGEKVLVPISPASVIIVKLYEEDKRRPIAAKGPSAESTDSTEASGGGF